MAITNEILTNRLDKKINYGVARTGQDSVKSPVQESVGSPSPNPAQDLWIDSDNIPAAMPETNTTDLLIYKYKSSVGVGTDNGASSGVIEMTLDTTVADGTSYLACSTLNNASTRLSGWVGFGLYGAQYLTKIVIATSGYHGQNFDLSGAAYYKVIQPGANGYEFYFDVDAGVLVFAGTSGVPTELSSGRSIYLSSGARYRGRTGIKNYIDVTTEGEVTVTGKITAPEANITVANVSTAYITSDATIATAKISDLTDGRVVLAGASGEIEDSSGLTFDGTVLTSTEITTPEANITVANVGTLYATTGTVGDLSFTKMTAPEANITVANIATAYITSDATIATAKISDLTSGRVVLAGTSGEIEDSTNLTFDGTVLTSTEVTTPEANITVANVSTAYITTSATMATAKVSDLTDGRVVLAGTSGELEDSSGLTFDGTVLTSPEITTPEANVTVANVATLYSKSASIDDISVISGITVGKNITVSGNLTVQGTTTTIDSTTLTVDDKNIELGSVDTPTDSTADGGGFTLKGATDKTIVYTDSSKSWDSNQDWHINKSTDDSVLKIDTVQIANSSVVSPTIKLSTHEANVTSVNTSSLYVTSDATIATAKISDLTDGRVVLAGTSGELEDSTNLTFDGTVLTSTEITTPEANVTVANVGTLYATSDATVATVKVSDLTDGRVVLVGTSGELEDSSGLTFDGTVLTSTEVTTPEANVTVANISTAYITTSATIFKEDVEEANITVSNTVTSYTTSSLVLPVGGDSSRVDTQGGIRYSTAQSTFEGYDGSAWGSLGGVIDIDQDTYIKAEVSDDNDTLDFYTEGTRQAYISNTGLVGITTKMTVPEANITVANVSTAYITTSATIADATIATAKVSDLTDGRVVLAGTSGEIEDSTNLTFDGTVLTSTEVTTPEANITVANVVTLYSTSSAVMNDVDISKVDAIEANITVANVSTAYITTDATIATVKVSDLTDGRVVLAGTSGELEDSSGLTFDGTVLTSTELTTPEANITVANVSTLYVTTAVGGEAILDEDNMASDSATKLATQQSIKAYVDAQIETEDTIEELNDTTITSVTENDVLTYRSGSWINSTEVDLAEANVTVANISTAHITTDATIATAKISDLTSGRVVLAGTAGEIEDSGNLTFDGTVLTSTELTTPEANITVANVGTLYATTGTVGDLSFTKMTTPEANITVANISTAYITTDATIATAKISDLTDGRVVLAGTAGEIEDSTNLTFDGTVLTSTEVTTPEANITVANVSTLYVTTSVGGEAILDDDSFATASATTLATSESIKAYVDAEILTEDTIAELNDTTITSITENDVLTYRGGSWINSTEVDLAEANVTVANISTAYITSDATIATVKVSDLTSGRVTLAGTSGELEDSSGLTFDGTVLTSTELTTPEANITVANVSTAYITTSATIFKEDVEESNVTVANISTAYITTDATIATAKISDLTDGRVVLAGTSGELEDSSGLTFDGTVLTSTELTTPEANITVANVSTAYITTSATIADATLSTAKISDLTDGRVVLAGTSGEIEDSSGLTFDGTVLTSTEVTTPEANITVANVSTAYITTEATIATAKVSDLTDGRVVLAGTGGEIEDSGALTFDGTVLTSTEITTPEANVTVANVTTLYVPSTATIGDLTTDNGVVIGKNLTVGGNLTVSGTTTTIDSTTLSVDDKNIELGSTASPTDTTADGGGITLKGTTDKTIAWENDTDSWDFNQDLNINKSTADSALKIDGTFVANTSVVSPSIKLTAHEANVTSVNTSSLYVTTDATIATVKVSDLTSGRVVLAGTSGEIEDSGNLTFDGTVLTSTELTTPEANITVANVSTAYITTSATIATAKVSDLTDGRVVLAGTSGEIEDSSGLTFDGTVLTSTELTTPEANITVANVSTAYITTSATIATAKVSDLTSGRVVLAGISGEIEDSSGLTYNSPVLTSTEITTPEANITVANVSTLYVTSSVGGEAILDEDNLVSDSATKLATQQSIKAYVDSQTTDETAEGSTNLYYTNARADARITNALIDEDNMASDSATKLPSQQSVKAYVDAQIATEDTIAELNDTTITSATENDVLTYRSGSWINSTEVDLAEANVTVANIGTLYTTSSAVIATAKVSDLTDGRVVLAGTSGEIEDSSGLTFDGTVLTSTEVTTPEANITVANVSTAYITSSATIFKEDVEEANVTVANVATLFVTSGVTVPTPTASGHAATKAYVDGVTGGSIIGNTIELGAVPDSSWHDGAFLANNVTYATNYLPTEGIENNDNITATLDTLNEVMHNVYRSTYVRHAKFTGSSLSGPATLTPTFTIDSEVYNTYDATRYDWNFGDGNTLSNQTATTQQHNYTTNVGSPFTVTLTAKNHNTGVTGSKGSFSTFKWVDMVVVYTNAPIPAFTYQYTQRDTSTVGPTSALSATINVDESTTSGSSQPITYNVTTSQYTTHWMLSFSDGTTYPSSATTGQTGSTLESNWEVYATTKIYAKTWTSITQDTNFTATLYCYSSTTDPSDPKRNSSGSPHNIRVFRDYTNIGTFTAVGYNSTLTGNNNEDVDNNAVASGASEDGMKVTLTPAVSSGSVNGTYSTQLQWSFEDAYNSESAASWNYTGNDYTNVKVVYFARQSNTTNNSGDVKTISAQISSSHTLSPFVVKIGGAATTDITIQKDPRSIWSAVFTTSSADASGGSTTKGYNFTDWAGDVRNSVQFTDASENVNAWSWDFDLDNAGSSTSTSQSPTNSYTTAGQYDIKLIATGANSETHRYASSADDTEQKNNYIEMVALPSYNFTYLASKSMSVTSQGSYTAKLCSGFTDNSGSETHGLTVDDTVFRRSSTTVTATKFSAYAREFVGDSGGYSSSVLTALINGSASGAKTFTTGSDNGTYTSLVVSDDADIQTQQSAFPTKFNRIYKGTISNASALSAGVNCYKLSHNNGASTTTSDVLSFVVDTAMSNTPTLNTYSVAMNQNGTVRYMSKMSYLRNTGTPKLAISSLNITNLAGECYADTSPIEVVDSSGSAVNGTKYLSYSDLSISTPLAKNASPTGLSGNVTITPSGKGIDGNIKLRGVNLNGAGNYVADSTDIMYWNDSPQLDEENVSAVSGGYNSRNSMIRVGGFTASATPSYTAADFYSTADWVSQTTTLAATDAPLIPHSTADRFVWDDTNWQTKLPGLLNNTDRSSVSGDQYVTFAVSKTNVNSFTLTLTGKISKMYCAFPGAGNGTNETDDSSGLDGWLDVGINYAGAGLPGSDTGNGGNGSNGIRNPSSPGTAPSSFAGQTLSSDTFNISLGTCNTANGSAHNHNILIRVVLASGHYLSAISFS